MAVKMITLGGYKHRRTETSLLTVAILCNNTKVVEGNLKDPTVALYKTAIESIGHVESKRIKEFP
jgi:hypothetical protein